MYLCDIEVEADKLITKKRLRGRFRRKCESKSASTLDHLSGFFIMETVEIWKDVIGYDGIYQVSNFGNVKSLRFGKEKVLKQSIDKYGYLQISLSKNKKCNRLTVHRLAYESFNGKTDLHIDHIQEGNKLDNRLCNLQALTPRENVSKHRLTTKKTSQYVGVNWDKSLNKWRAQIQINGKRKHLGCFINEHEAGIAYQNALQNVLRTS